MLRSLLLSAVMISSAALMADDITDPTAPASTNATVPAPVTVSDTNDQSGVKDLIHSFQSAWNAHDPNGMSTLWVMDGDLIDPWGSAANGQDAVKAMFTQDQTGRFKNSVIEQEVANVRFATPDIALVDVNAKLSGAKDSNGVDMASFDHHVVFLVVKKDGQWKIAAARPYAFATVETVQGSTPMPQMR